LSPFPPFHLFERFGVELEYMIVDAVTLDVRPIADQVLHGADARRRNEIRHGGLRWSNELVRHVIELKTDGPAPTLDGLAATFQEGVAEINRRLAPAGCRLLPGGMHPWMDPHRETVLWPHEDREIYDAFNRIFDCRGHGWSNLQSTHINLPFSGDDEFRRLHGAIRLLLPLIPAIAAASPYADGVAAPVLDMRLEVYRHNCDRIPSLTGHLVPERVRSRAEYESELLGRLYRDLEPYDPDGTLRDEWVNARGAIARFSRGAIEIRVIDNQECPAMDLALLRFFVHILQGLIGERWAPLADQELCGCQELEVITLDAIRQAEDARVRNPNYLRGLGLVDDKPDTLGQILWLLWQRCGGAEAPDGDRIRAILRHGNLARRLRRAGGRNVSRERLRSVYSQLADCLAEGRMFING
jgi:gamma-glutamyl:cysteine ligase YbdK (ATP-grasp superfamily)